MLATGGAVVDLVYVSMSARHPEGRDVDYLRWHFFDHRPEQYRLDTIRGSLRLVSTPECRAARAASDERFDATDHVMNYFFSDPSGLKPFHDLGRELGKVGRIPELLPSVERGVYAFDGRVAAPDAKVGADVLPWWPSTGVYLLIEQGTASAAPLVDVDGVAGAWWAPTADVPEQYTLAQRRSAHLPLPRRRPGRGRGLRPVLEQRGRRRRDRPVRGAVLRRHADDLPATCPDRSVRHDGP